MGYNKSLATFLLRRQALVEIRHKADHKTGAINKSPQLTSVLYRQHRVAHRRKACCSLRRNRLIHETSCQASSSLRKRMDQPHKLRAVAVCRPIRAAVSLYLLLLRSHSSLLRLLLAVASADHSPRNSCVI